jgi:hypothetical protein
MKFTLSILAFLAVLFMAAVQAQVNGPLAGFVFLAVGNLAIGALSFRGQQPAQCFTPTLILPMLNQYIAPAFRTKVPELRYFSVDTGKVGNQMPEPVKWNQEVISHIAKTPTATAFTPGQSLITGAVDVTTLVDDVKMKINKASIVRIKLTAATAAELMADGAFLSLLSESGVSLGRFVVAEAIAQATQGNFSRELVTTLANSDFDVLSDATTSLNSVGAHTPRFMLAGSTFMQTLGSDPRVASGDFRAQKIGSDPYREYTGIEGFESVREFPNMPTNNVAVGSATVANAGDLLTLNAHGLANGTRIRLTGTMPAGLSLNTDYYVIAATTNTFQVAIAPGGAAVVISADGTVTVSKFEALNAIAFAKGSLHVAIRPLLSNVELAAQLGIPQTIKTEQVTDEETGLSFTVYTYMDPTTTDIYAAVVVFFGVRAGRALGGATTPATEAAGTAYDFDGLRIVETATTLVA